MINPVVAKRAWSSFASPAASACHCYSEAKIASTLCASRTLAATWRCLTGSRQNVNRRDPAPMDPAFLREPLRRGSERLARQQLEATLMGRNRTKVKSGLQRNQRSIATVYAEKYAKAKNVVFSWTMGVTHHVHGVRECASDCERWRCFAWHGRPAARCGLMPIRGHIPTFKAIGSVWASRRS